MDDYNTEEVRKPLFEIIPPKEESTSYASYGGLKEDLYGDSHLVSVKVQLNGTDFFTHTNIKLELKQKINGLHEFTVICDPDEFGENESVYLLKNSREYLGKRITFQFRQFGKTTSTFTGIITQLSAPKKDGIRQIVLSGKSPSILMENGLHCRSFEDKTFEEIIKEVAKGYPESLLNFHINPNYKERLEYIVQYNLSDWDFLQQLSNRFGENLYYNGTDYCLSAWGGKIIELMEGEDVYDYDLKMEVQPQKFSYTAYDPKNGEEYTLDSTGRRVEPSKNPFQQHAAHISENLYTVSPTAHYDHSLLLSGALGMQRSLENDKRKRQNLVYIEARSNNPHLRVGDVAKMMAWMPEHEIFKNGRVPIESYKITEIVHTFADGEGYSNTFVGVPKDLPVPSYYEERQTPKAEIQHARVTDNRDPLKMGRLRVQFVWQKPTNQQTPWIQVIQPHAGAGKGTYFNAEINEIVLVAFKGGNIEAPIVLGAAYNGGEIAEYYTEGNDVKVIQTRSGTKIVFNDAEGQGSVLIEDPSGNRMFMDGQGNIKTYAPKDIEMNAGENMKINVGNDLHFTVGNQATFDIMQKMLINTPFMQQLVSNYYHTQAGTALINSENQIKIESPETFVQGGQKLMLHSDELATLNSQGVAEMKGETKNSLSNKANSYTKNALETKADCVIHFRPGKNYQDSPDFGFDYIRLGDTGYKGDVWYRDVIGRYKDSSGNLTQIYFNGKFTKDSKEYSKIGSTFEQIILKKKQDAQKSDYIYYVPKMTLIKGKEANLVLKLKIEKEPKKLEFIYDKSYFELAGFTNDQITKKSKGTHTLNLKVKCKKVFSYDQSISIMADKEICGKLLVKANNYSFNINVVFVEVRTNIQNDSTGIVYAKEQNKLRDVLNQAYIDVNIKNEKLDLTGFFTSKWFWLNYTKNGQIDTAGLHKYLNDKMTNKYKDYYKIYIFGESSGGLNGIAEGIGGVKSAIVFPGRTGDASMATSSHELLHSLGLYHTFDNDSKFTFERDKIDNVMDYSHWSGIPRCSTTHWQWQLLQQKLSSYKTLAK